MNHALLFIASLLVAVLSALFAVPHFVDWNGYRGVFEEEASRVLGREVRVGGAVNVRLLPTPYVRFEKVRVADATGGTGEPFFRADTFTLWLSVPPLLRGVLEANAIELKRPRLNLVTDAAGRGSWSTLNFSQGSLPFVPAGVSLQAVRISDGSIGFSAGAGGGELQLAGLNGEFEAEALEGPYKFKGELSWGGTERQVRLSTARPDPDGSVRMKAVFTAPLSGNSYVLDGRMSDLRERVRFDGEFQGKMQIDGLGPPQPARTPATAAGGAASTKKTAKVGGEDGQRPYLDIKTAVAADLTAARFGQLVMSVENVGQPQLVTGDARMAWADNATLELALASRWLDLDRLAGRNPADQPIDTAQSLVSALLGQLPGAGRVDARFEVEQTSLGGEAVSGLTLKLAREGGPLEIRELRAGLPGGARLDIVGTLAAGTASPQLDGTLVVRGSSLTRFLTWAGKSTALTEGRIDGPFLVRGALRLSETELALTDAVAELQGVPLTGDIRHEMKDRRQIAIRLEGQSVDLAQVWPGATDWLATVVPSMASAAKSPEPVSASPANPGAGKVAASNGFSIAETDVTLRVRVAELIAGARTLRDVDADLAVEHGRISIPRLRLSTSDGLDLDLEGQIVDATTAPKGILRGLVAADRPGAVEALFRALGETAAVDAPQGQIAALAPLRLAGRIALGQRSASATDIDADGIVQGGRFVASARLDGGWRGWRDGQAEITVSADSPDIDHLLRLALGASAEASRGRTSRRGQLNIKAQGVPVQGMLTAAELQSPGLVLSYDGPLKLAKGVPSAIDGEIRITADDIAEALELAGIPLGGAASGVPVDGVLTVTARDNVLTLKPREMTVGAHRIAGNLILAQRSGRPSTVTADIELGEVTLADLLSPVLERRSQAASMGATSTEAAAGPWPDLGFDLQPLERLEGTIDLRFRQLKLKDQLSIRDGRMVAKLAPGRVDVETLIGTALGGRVKGTASLARTKGGVDGKVSLQLAELQPGLLAGERSAARSGSQPVTLTLDLEGRAQSPRGLIAAMKGKGLAEVMRLEMPGLTPSVVVAQSDAFVTGKLEAGEGALARALGEAVAGTVAAVPAGKHRIEIPGDGTLRAKQIAIETSSGRTTIDATLDLDSLRLDSEWRIEPAASAAPKGVAVSPSGAAVRSAALPAVFVVYAGDLAALAAIEPRISAGALERELQVRRMERDVEELERLRREDEQRRAAELARQMALEAERARAAAEAAAAAQSIGGTSAAPPPAVAPPPPPGAASPPAPDPTSGASAPPTGASPAAPIAVAPAVTPERSGTSPRPPPAPRPVRRVSPGDEIMRQLSPN